MEANLRAGDEEAQKVEEFRWGLAGHWGGPTVTPSPITLTLLIIKSPPFALLHVPYRDRADPDYKPQA